MSAAPPSPRMSRPLAWAIVSVAGATLPAMLAAPFVPAAASVPVGMGAGSCLLALSLLVGLARMRAGQGSGRVP